MLPLLRGRLDSLAEQIDADPTLVNRPFPESIAAKPVVEALPFREERSCMWPQSTATFSPPPLYCSTAGLTSMPAQQSMKPVSGDTQRTLPRRDAIRRWRFPGNAATD